MIDLEDVCDNLGVILTNRLNPKIFEIDAEKADFTLLPIDPGAIFFQQLSEKTVNYDPFLVYGVLSESMKNAGHSSASEVNIFICIGMASDNTDNLSKRLLRYSRAIREIISEAFDVLSPELVQTGPIVFTDSNTQKSYHGIGLEFKMTLPFN